MGKTKFITQSHVDPKTPPNPSNTEKGGLAKVHNVKSSRERQVKARARYPSPCSPRRPAAFGRLSLPTPRRLGSFLLGRWRVRL